jgi:hypothetical protein
MNETQKKFLKNRNLLQKLKWLGPLVIVILVGQEYFPEDSILAEARIFLTPIILILLASFVFTYMLLWRCPSCKKIMGRLDVRLSKCPHCGIALIPKKKEP